MQQLTNCPVCDSPKISFRNQVGNCERPKEPLHWSLFGCDDCGLGFLNPQPSWQELIPYYPPDYLCYNTHVDDEDAVVEEAKRRGEYRHIPVPAGKRLLDVGCGGGSFLQVLKKLGVEVKGVEPGESAAAAARDSGLDVFTGTLEEYIAQNGTEKKFDVITCSHVLMATPSPAQTLDCMRQLLAPDGYIWVSVPNLDCESARLLGWRWHSAYFPRNIIQFTPKTLSKAGEVAGLVIRRQSTYSFPAAVAYSLCLRWRHRWFLPHKISSRLLSENYLQQAAKELDSRGEGEAILMEFGHPQSLD
ncbi:class I SAM-dependent methyltransferase [Microcoleus sp. A006_D1]|uniref:class I SAM-dependent methyltransferase n=1 Tax=Microcoleus sp. A006_D1 TaxID=3055267 RepID=UPI002FCEB65C